MSKNLISICTVLILSAVCNNVSAAKPMRTDTAQGMISYLQKLKLPTVESVAKWENKYADGLVITTKHYQVYTTMLEPLMLSQVPGFMESAWRGYNSQLPSPVETKTKFTVYIFAERMQWDDFTKTFAGPQAKMYLKIKAGAYYLNGSCVAYNIGRERTFATIGHEGWHQFNSRFFKYRLPSWLDEGVAMMFEASRYDQGLFYFEPSQNMYRLGALKMTLIKNKMIPLHDLIGLNPGEVLDDGDDTVAAFYGQAYALVRFLREENYGRLFTNYSRMLFDGMNGSWPIDNAFKEIAGNRNIPMTVEWNHIIGPKLFERYISADTDKIEKEYTDFCRKIVYFVHVEK